MTKLLASCRPHILFIGLLVFYFIIRCFYLDAVPRWDAASYWDALRVATESTKNAQSWDDFYLTLKRDYNAFGHTSMGYYGILVLGQLVDFPNLFILNLTNILLACLSIYCFYKILLWFFPDNRNRTEVLLATAAYAFNPLFFGCSIFLNTDFPVQVFFTAAFASLLYGRYLLFGIASFFMIFSKETGALFYGALGLGIGIPALFSFLRNPKHFFTIGPNYLFPGTHTPIIGDYKYWRALGRVLCLITPGIILIAYMMIRKGEVWAAESSLGWNSEGWNTFGFRGEIVLARLSQTFILNFHWICSLLLIVLFFIGIGRKIESGTLFKSSSHRKLWAKLGLYIAFFLFVAFNVTYMTFILPRYVVAAGFFLIFCLLIVLNYSINSTKKRQAILAAILVLFGIQTFKTVDPVSKLVFGTAPFSENTILQIDGQYQAVGNGFVYNSEYTAVDKLFNIMQKTIKMDDNTRLYMWHRDWWFPWLRNGVYVNRKSYERTIDSRNGFSYNFVNIDDIGANPKPQTAYYVYMPWLSKMSNEQEELNLVRQHYSVGPSQVVGYMGYKIHIYQLTLLPQ